MAADEPEYIQSANPTEVARLTYNHQVIFNHEKRMVYCPVDLAKPGLRILDSGCADGLWLKDLQPAISSRSYELVGADITPSYFPTSLPPSTRLIQQSITKPWPVEMHDSFDFVHQRTVMPACGIVKCPMLDAIKGLASIVKPGGWLQLEEVDPSAKAVDGPAFQQFQKLTQELLRFLNDDVAFARDMKSWMLQAGFEDVQERIVDVPQGNAIRDNPNMAATSRKSLELCTRAMVAPALEHNFSHMSRAELDAIVPALEKELADVGGYQRYYMVWGRKPA